MPDRPAPAALTGMDVVSAFGHGTKPLLDNVVPGRAAFGPVGRFDVADRRVGVAATMAGAPVLLDELVRVVEGACDEAGLSTVERAGTPLLLAVHGDPGLARAARDERPGRSAGALAVALAGRCGLASALRAYTSACVAASTAVADAGSLLARGHAERVVVAAGYLVEPDQFALFDAGRALATDGQVRPFSAKRTGLLLGDGVAAVVLESGSAVRRTPLAWLAGWGRAGDAYHVCRPDPTGAGLARAIGDALRRGGIAAGDVGYLNAPRPRAGSAGPPSARRVGAGADRCRRGGRPAGPRTAIVIASPLGDVASAVHVADAVDHRTRVGPLLFYQSVPNAVAGHVAARFGLAGPVVCTSPVGDPLADGLATADLLLDDGDCDEALVVVVTDTAHALLVRPNLPEAPA